MSEAPKTSKRELTYIEVFRTFAMLAVTLEHTDSYMFYRHVDYPLVAILFSAFVRMGFRAFSSCRVFSRDGRRVICPFVTSW